jgi:hypothetical protein
MLIRGVAQTGSALAWGASGRRFKSGRPDQKWFNDQTVTHMRFSKNIRCLRRGPHNKVSKEEMKNIWIKSYLRF